MSGTVRIKITELNPHLICVLCGGYYIDAATIRECLHSFCRTCISKYLETTKYCPICDVMVHKTKPLQFIKSDKNLQDLVYKLVPGLYKDEMKRRREFYAARPEADSLNPLRPTEARGYEDKDRLIYTEDEKISLALELFADIPEPIKRAPESSDRLQQRDIRYLQCPAAVSIAHLKKFIRLKFDLPPKYTIDIYHSDEPLKDFFTLMDIAYIYTWRRTAPLRLLYTVYEQVTKKRKNASEDVTNQTHKQARLEENDQENPKVNKPTENCDTSSSETDQYDENSSPDENEYHTKEPKLESNESADEKTKNSADDNDNDEQKFTSSKNYKPSANKPKLTEKDSVKNIMSGKKSAPKSLHEQGGKFFSSNFYKRKAALQADICADSPLDMTKKTLKKLKDTTTKKVGKEQSMLNGSHFTGYEFTD